MKKPLMLFLSFLMGVSLMAQTRLYVNQSNGNDANKGTSWSEAFSSLDQALAVAGNEDSEVSEIWVAEGRYVPQNMAGNGVNQKDRAFVLPANVKIYGGFQGTESELADRLPAAKGAGGNGLSVLSGEIAPGDTVINVVIGIAYSGEFIHLDGFTVEGSNTNISGAAPITVNGKTVSRITSDVIYCNASVPASGSGKAGDIILENNTIIGRRVYAVANVYSTGNAGTVTFSNNAVSGCEVNALAAADFGGDAVMGGTISLISNTITGGKVNADVTVIGKGLKSGTISLVNNSILYSNVSAFAGIATPLVSDNHVVGGRVDLINNTLIFNQGQKLAVGASSSQQEFAMEGYVVMYNTLIWGNSGNNFSFDKNSFHVLAFYNCLVEGKTADELNGYSLSGYGLDNLDGTIVSAKDVFAAASAGNYRLASGSPAIDAGNNRYVPSYLTTDVDGKARIVGESVDVGAYEYNRPEISQAYRLYVKQDGGSDANNGSSWDKAFETLDKALEIAAENSPVKEIWVAEGIYVPQNKAGNGISEHDRAFVLPADVKVYGGFLGIERNIEERIQPKNGKGSNGLTILSGEIAPGDTVINVVIGIAYSGEFIHLDGFTVEGSNTNISGAAPITVNGKTVSRITSDVIYCNASDGSGKAGDIILENNTITGRRLYAVSNTYSTGYAGTITFRSNAVSQCEINAFAAADFVGGAAMGGTISFISNTITGGKVNADATIMGEGLKSGTISLVNNSILYSNVSAFAGIATPLVSDNHVVGGRVDLINNTLVFNQGQKLAVGASSSQQEFAMEGYVVMYNTLIWGNSGDNFSFDKNSFHVLAFYNCLVEGKTADELNGYSLPGYGLDNLDGTTVSDGDVFAAASAGNYRLASGSPAIDAGNNRYVPSYLITDVDGNARIVGESVDVGAYEYQSGNLRKVTGLENIGVENVILEVVGNTLYIHVPEVSQVRIYTLSGIPVADIQVKDTYSLPLDAGIYIIHINGKSYKMAI